MAHLWSQMPAGEPRIPVLWDLEIDYHEQDENPLYWEFDYSRMRFVYTGPCTMWYWMWGSPRAQLMGDFRIAQRLPFPWMWTRPCWQYGHGSDDAARSVATSLRGYVPRGRAYRSSKERTTVRRRRIHLSESYTDLTPALHVYRRHRHASVGSNNYPRGG